MFDPPTAFVSGDCRVKLAREAWEVAEYWELRRRVFCREQGLFGNDDRDEEDGVATPIVAVSNVMGMGSEVVGTVRIYPVEAATWYGSRLGVREDYRGVGRLAANLIWAAVTTAGERGCERFLAKVQVQNVAMFRRLHWKSLGEIECHGRPHHLMEADLLHYRPRPARLAIDPLARRKAS